MTQIDRAPEGQPSTIPPDRPRFIDGPAPAGALVREMLWTEAGKGVLATTSSRVGNGEQPQALTGAAIVAAPAARGLAEGVGEALAARLGVVAGAGMGVVGGSLRALQFTAMNTLTLGDLGDAHTSSGNSLLSVVVQLSMSLGVATAGALLGGQ